jgi:polyhydroxyalkanoate synthesis repressor PhaR
MPHSSSDIARLIRRYESRKLYDTEESRYVSLDELATWVRDGQQVRVIDVATDGDVTAQTLTQIILEEGKKGVVLSSELLHDLVRRGERAVATGVHQVKAGVENFVQRSLDRLAPVQKAREEMAELKARLADLETSLSQFSDAPRAAPGSPAKAAARVRRPQGKSSASAGPSSSSTSAASAAKNRKKGESS